MLMLASKDKALQRQIREYLSTGRMPSNSFILVRNESEWQKALGDERPRLVMLDDGVSLGNGVAWLAALRRRLPEVLVIYVAEQHSLELEKTVRQLGVLYYTGKPPDSLLLSQVLTSALPSLFGSGHRLSTSRFSPASEKHD